MGVKRNLGYIEPEPPYTAGWSGSSKGAAALSTGYSRPSEPPLTARELQKSLRAIAQINPNHPMKAASNLGTKIHCGASIQHATERRSLGCTTSPKVLIC